jgi:DNA polymerase-3 subunit alpha
MAALLTSDQQNIDRIAVEIEECRHMGIEVARPDINQSFGSFTVVTSGTEKNEAVGEKEELKTIRFGLKAIKNMGEHIADTIISERKERGPFKDITDLLERVTDKDLNKKSMEALIKSGALDNFSERGQLLGNIENILSFSKEAGKSKINGQTSLFADAPILNISHKIKLEQKPPVIRGEKLSWEKELLGVYISEHPFTELKKILDGVIIPFFDLAPHLRDSAVTIAGVISTIKKIVTRTNESMLFVKIEDTVGNLEILVFPSLLKGTAEIWKEGRVIICQGKLSDKDNELKLLANKVSEINIENKEEVLKNFKPAGSANGRVERSFKAAPAVKPLKLIFNKEPLPDILGRLKDIFLKHVGESKVYFKIKQNGEDRILETAFRVKNNDDLVKTINQSFNGSVVALDNKA